MKSGTAIICAGLIMFIFGLIAFYSIDANPASDNFLLSLKHTGTFIGLMGIGVAVAGILLFLISRGSPQQEQTSDT